MTAKVNPFSKKTTLNLKGKVLDLSTPRIMGILNVTPDSFYDGGRYDKNDQLIVKVEKMLSEGADIIDIGGYSSRPGADHIEESVEQERVLNAVRQILLNFPDTIISIDTFRASVARASIDAGGAMINDISGGEADPEMFDLVAAKKVPYVIMHMRGNPQNMSKLTDYDNLLKNIQDYFLHKIEFLRKKGVNDLIIDPGFGFAKTMDQNYELLKNLNYFEVLEVPLLVGLSRKSMFYKLLKITPEESLNATTAAHMVALTNGASILRVHDVKEASEAIKIFKLTES